MRNTVKRFVEVQHYQNYLHLIIKTIYKFHVCICFATSFGLETMLTVSEILLITRMLKELANNDVFHEFVAEAGYGDESLVGRYVAISFIVGTLSLVSL